jgi:hypothetical protein
MFYGRMMQEPGAEFLFESRAIGVKGDAGRVGLIAVRSRSGLYAVKARFSSTFQEMETFLPLLERPLRRWFLWSDDGRISLKPMGGDRLDC